MLSRPQYIAVLRGKARPSVSVAVERHDRRAQSLGSPLTSSAAEDALEGSALFSLCLKARRGARDEARVHATLCIQGRLHFMYAVSSVCKGV